MSATTGVVYLAATGAVAYYVYCRSRSPSKPGSGTHTTDLRGPPRKNWLAGQTEAIWGDDASPDVLEGWATTYGAVYKRPGPVGTSDIFFTDPKAIAALFSRSDDVYHLHTLWRVALENLVGGGLIAADGEDHKRQRKQISPGFTTVRIREYSEVFFTCSQKMATRLESLTEKTGEHVDDIQVWLNALSLDTIGLAGFSHDFKSLSDHRSDISNAFEVLANNSLGIMDGVIAVLQPTFPLATRIPTQRSRGIRALKEACAVVAKDFMSRLQEEKGERSVMGLLNKASTTNTGIPLTESDVQSQIVTLLVAGYETTSTTLTWALIELCRKIDLQARVRKEILAQFPNSDPTFDEVMNDLPLLDGVVQEALRLHPSVLESWRTAQKDDVLPLSTPITLPDGSLTDRIVIAEGTTVAVNMAVVNRSRALWGPDATEFRPERWIEGLPERAQEIVGYRHLLTFLDGPKMCLGKSFAVANMKIALTILLRRFTFELPDGPETKFEPVHTAVTRVKTAGQEGCKVPMRIRRVD